MMNKMKEKISKAFCGNVLLNKKALEIKKSWDEVSAVLDKLIKKRR